MWRRWKAGQGKLCFVSCSHQRASAGKYLFPQTQQGLQFVQLSARTQNDGPRLLAQKLPERDNQPRIIDGPERVRNITSLFRCFTVMSDRSDHPSVPTYLRRPSCFSVRLERRFSVPACNLTERWSQRRSREARSRAEPRAAASLRRAWRARRALDLDGPLRPTLDQAGCVRTSASASHNPYSASGSGSGKPIKKRDHNSINCRDPAQHAPQDLIDGRGADSTDAAERKSGSTNTQHLNNDAALPILFGISKRAADSFIPTPGQAENEGMLEVVDCIVV